MIIFKIIMPFLFAAILFFINMYLDNKIDKKIKIILPTAYIFIIAALFHFLKNTVALIVVYEIIFEIFYYYISDQSIKLKDWLSYILTLVIALFVYEIIIVKVDSLIPDASDLLPWAWFLIIIFLYIMIFKTDLKSKKKEFNLDKEYIIVKWAKYKARYKDTIKASNSFTNLVISILIYETTTNNPFEIKIKNLINKITNREDKQFNEKELVKSITNNLSKYKNKRYKVNNKDLNKYISKVNNDSNYINTIKNIYKIIDDFN